MPSKKKPVKKVVEDYNPVVEDNIDEIFDEDEEDAEAEEVLAESEDVADEILGPPAIVVHKEEKYPEYPTESHIQNKVKYRPGDIAPPFNEFLIIRKDQR
jgi:hypothetical protein